MDKTSYYTADTYVEYHNSKEKITDTATYLIAAYTISNPQFPMTNMPRFFPTPFNNFGHYYLFDHKLYLEIIWTVANEIKKVSRTSNRLAVISITIILSIVFLPFTNLFIVLFVPFIYRVINNAFSRKRRNKIAAIRAKYIKLLIKEGGKLKK